MLLSTCLLRVYAYLWLELEYVPNYLYNNRLVKLPLCNPRWTPCFKQGYQDTWNATNFTRYQYWDPSTDFTPSCLLRCVIIIIVCCSFKSLLKIVDLKVLGTEVVFIMTVKGTQEEIAKLLNAQDNYVWFDMFPLNENLYLITITTHCHLRDVSFASIAHGVAKSCG